MDEVAKKSSPHAVRHEHRGNSEIDSNDVKVRFSDAVVRSFAELYKAMGGDGKNDTEDLLTLREFVEDRGGRVKVLIVQLPQIALDIQSSGNEKQEAAMREVFDALAGDKSVMVPMHAPVRGRGTT